MSKQGAWIITGIFGTPCVLLGFLLSTLIQVSPATAAYAVFAIVVCIVAVCHAWGSVDKTSTDARA